MKIKESKRESKDEHFLSSPSSIEKPEVHNGVEMN